MLWWNFGNSKPLLILFLVVFHLWDMLVESLDSCAYPLHAVNKQDDSSCLKAVCYCSYIFAGWQQTSRPRCWLLLARACTGGDRSCVWVISRLKRNVFSLFLGDLSKQVTVYVSKKSLNTLLLTFMQNKIEPVLNVMEMEAFSLKTDLADSQLFLLSSWNARLTN